MSQLHQIMKMSMESTGKEVSKSTKGMMINSLSGKVTKKVIDIRTLWHKVFNSHKTTRLI